MSEPIVLTSEEEWAAHQAVAPLLGSVALNRQQPDYAVAPVVEAIVNAVNKVRVGDPVGTIRRSDNGVVGLRVDADGFDPWVAFTPHGNPCGTWTQSQVSKWAVVFRPEVS